VGSKIVLRGGEVTNEVLKEEIMNEFQGDCRLVSIMANVQSIPHAMLDQEVETCVERPANNVSVLPRTAPLNGSREHVSLSCT
jgi:hypothetical protein